MTLRVPAPRVLPMTIAVMAVLLGVKSFGLVRAAAPGGTGATVAGVPPAQAATPPAAPPATPPAAHGGKEAPKEAAKPVPAATAPSPAAPAPPNPAQSSPAPDIPAVSDSERALLLDLRQRRGQLEAREAALAAREAVLLATEKRLAVRVDELTVLQGRLEALEKARRERDDANWNGLVKLYEAMKPRDAATIFNDLEPAVLLAVLDRMKEIKAAPVLAAMQPDRARTVTAQLAQLRARANAAPGAPGAPPRSGG